MARAWFRAFVVIALGASCVIVDTAPAQPRDPDPPAGFRLYTIDPSRSDLRWHVYSGGPFARFGHDYVVVAGRLSGRVLVHPRFGESRFELEIPVTGLRIELATAGAGAAADSGSSTAAGLDADGLPLDDAAENVALARERMLGEQVLDAERYPTLRANGIGPSVEAGEQSLDVTLEIRDGIVALTVPTEIAVDPSELTASGAFRVTHEEMGMEPFSALMGALQVDEPLDVTYRIVAVRME